jgi:ABC-type microcin C transport system duplicated ATPase subunit YejF
MPDTLLHLDGLKTYFDLEEGTVRAVDGVSFALEKGETLGLVGESGCGKSVTAMSILQLNPVPPTRYESGRILFEGRDLLTLPVRELRAVRGNEIAMIFQEPMTSLNPVYTVGDQIGEVLELHRKMKPRESRLYSIEMLKKVGIPSPDDAHRQLPAPDVGRHEAACDDRHGAGLRSQAADRRTSRPRRST